MALLPQKIIVNCLGMGARRVVQDLALIPVRGQLVHLKPQELPYLLSHSGYVFPRRDAVVLGGSVEWNKGDATPNAGVCRRILARNQRFFT